jgi:hypothetical protein
MTNIPDGFETWDDDYCPEHDEYKENCKDRPHDPDFIDAGQAAPPVSDSYVTRLIGDMQ